MGSGVMYECGEHVQSMRKRRREPSKILDGPLGCGRESSREGSCTNTRSDTECAGWATERRDGVQGHV